MSTALDFYFDFSSPYGYFGATKIEALAAAAGREVEWHPLLLGAIFKNIGTASLVSVPLKGPYSLHDMQRSARFHGIPFRMPDTFPVSTQIAARAMLWIKQHLGKAVATQFALAVYHAYFYDNQDIGSLPLILDIAAANGADRPQLEAALAQDEIKNALKASIEAALERGVFGAPFVIVDGEAFWGLDRFEQLAAFLKNGSI
ncbi:2-hydroxychromene-2-carboxylate isomerase [Herbaspirillum sp. RTI4]|uniref:2-hydroxychromene-2-carboxylate isomerase n=1 Tax=Herbaspirillum sp. RTI4 TaxID=3048640 RepID=UPI002AB4250C|nr:2-hydroxychromene-2-carboxylate isomerase [Herbaspirillum sp. RTI4]MDY7577422.1 2-hydroxychromene-2-carboxylate isomerase [Herbaspirillum sp. RTI4]MEA9981698.1 2-hydroxychromene-2-carboxylate isomerase [Herbaspirillum sp. RTI4]